MGESKFNFIKTKPNTMKIIILAVFLAMSLIAVSEAGHYGYHGYKHVAYLYYRPYFAYRPYRRYHHVAHPKKVYGYKLVEAKMPEVEAPEPIEEEGEVPNIAEIGGGNGVIAYRSNLF